jgi:hypothetical protein
MSGVCWGEEALPKSMRSDKTPHLDVFLSEERAE